MKYPQITQIKQISFYSWFARKSAAQTVGRPRCDLAQAQCSISNRNLRNLPIANFGWFQ
jgi:hypothetical protein